MSYTAVSPGSTLRVIMQKSLKLITFVSDGDGLHPRKEIWTFTLIYLIYMDCIPNTHLWWLFCRIYKKASNIKRFITFIKFLLTEQLTKLSDFKRESGGFSLPLHLLDVVGCSCCSCFDLHCVRVHAEAQKGSNCCDSFLVIIKVILAILNLHILNIQS